MKKQILIILMFAATCVFAQDKKTIEPIKKGTIYAGLNVGMNTQKYTVEQKVDTVLITQEPRKYFYWDINPEVFYFLMDNMALGFYVGMNGSRNSYTEKQGTNTDIENTFKSKGPNFGISLRKFFNCSNNFRTFAGVGVGLSSYKGEEEMKTTTTFGGTTMTTSVIEKNQGRNFNVNLMAGFAYNISPSVMLIGQFAVLNYYTSLYKYNMIDGSYIQNKSNGVNLFISSGNIPFNLGFLYLLNAKKMGKK